MTGKATRIYTNLYFTIFIIKFQEHIKSFLLLKKRKDHMTSTLSHTQKMWLLIGGGFLAGFLNGLLGAGGGILLVYVMTSLLSSSSESASSPPDKRDAFANAIATMLPISAVSTVNYAAQGALTLSGAEIFIFPAIIGGVAGAILLDKLRFDTVRKLFTLLITISGIAMLVK